MGLFLRMHDRGMNFERVWRRQYSIALIARVGGHFFLPGRWVQLYFFAAFNDKTVRVFGTILMGPGELDIETVHSSPPSAVEVHGAIHSCQEGLNQCLDVILAQVGAEGHHKPVVGGGSVKGVGESAPHHVGARCHQKATRLNGAVGGDDA